MHEGGGGGCGGGDSGWALLAVAEHESTPPHPFLISAWESLSVSAMFQGAGPRAHLLNSREHAPGAGRRQAAHDRLCAASAEDGGSGEVSGQVIMIATLWLRPRDSTTGNAGRGVLCA